MNDVYTVFLSLVSSIVHEGNRDDDLKVLPGVQEIDLKALYEVAYTQNMAGFLFPRLRTVRQLQDRLSAFEKEFITDVFLSVNRADILREIDSLFSEAGIDYMCMKGSVYREYYPIPELRSMGDMDLIIHPEDRQMADIIMTEKLGCRKFVDNHAVWTYYLDDFFFEIHDHMFYEDLSNQVDYQAYFDQVWEHCHHSPVYGVESSRLYVPDEEFHFLYLMAHTAKHVINNGSGFRSYLDMVFMSNACDSLDWKYLEKELNRLSLTGFTQICFRLCERWFKVSMPLQKNELSEDFFKQVTEKTFSDGVFGLENTENRGASAAKEIRRSSVPYYLAAIKRGLRLLFPPYEDMQLIPWYSFVDGRPWLLPAAWIYRFFYCLTKKKGHSRYLLTEPFLEKDMVKERQKYLQKWRL